MDDNTVRVEGFFEARCRELELEVKSLKWDNSELDARNMHLFERVEKLANRHPVRPQRNFNKPQRQFNSNK
jgi:hypothetical protein